MLFNSYVYIFLFLPVVFMVYFFLNNLRLTVAARGWLVFASLLFYSWWNIKYLPLILGSVIFNFSLGSALSSDVKIGRKGLLFVGITANLSLLGYFKYLDFFIANFNMIFDTEFGFFRLALPLAISFFTFQQITYLVDSYNKKVHEHDFLSYATFVTFFPQLIAGPIVHHQEMMPQFKARRNKIVSYRNIHAGLLVFCAGLLKKAFVADTLAVWATNGFDHAIGITMIEAWSASLAYTFQLYFDFSGYTDMAIGSALMFNIKLPLNFNSPYKALDIQDFWRRWHMTLTRFLRDYVYIPLGGNRKGEIRTHLHLLGTFLIGGLWHGAAWTFVFWGLLHGLGMSMHRIWKLSGYKLPRAIAWFITFNFVNVAWVFFRAISWHDAFKILRGMAGFNGFGNIDSMIGLGNLNVAQGPIGLLLFCVVLIISATAIVLFKNTNELRAGIKPNFYHSALTAIMGITGVASLSKATVFLYFNF